MPIPMLIGAAAGFMPSVVDWISGASADRRAAIDRRNRALDAMLGDTRSEMGQSVTSSGAFKTGMGVLDNNFKKRQRQVNGRAIASGATPEANAGMMEGMNSAFNTGALGVLAGAQRRRDMLKQQYNSLMGQRTGYDIADANETLNAQGNWTRGITSMLPYILDMNGEKSNVEKP